MATALKLYLGAQAVHAIASEIEAGWPGFRSTDFSRDALDGLDDLELKARALHIATTLHNHLPPDFPTAIRILIGSLEKGTTLNRPPARGNPFQYMPHTCFISLFGLEDYEASMDAMRRITPHFTAEFCMRPFLVTYPDRTLDHLNQWTRNPCHHVRRLASECTRPRLPWAPHLPAFIVDPSPVLSLLEWLKDDPEPYVRKSVANNLNDIAKDHPDLVISCVSRWLFELPAPHRRWIAVHALRTLTKQGNPQALAVIGYAGKTGLGIEDAVFVPQNPRIGQTLSVRIGLHNPTPTPCPTRVDLRVHFVKSQGNTRPKTFRVRMGEIPPNTTWHLSKSLSLKQQTTRTHFPGPHRVELILNGQAIAFGSFDLKS